MIVGNHKEVGGIKVIALKDDRLEKILALLEEREHLTVSLLSDELGVSSVTIRKDLTLLESKGFLYRTHGGASKKSNYTFERSIHSKKSINIEEKTRIAKCAMSYVEANDSIILTSGSTIHCMAREMRGVHNLTVLTPSLPVAFELCNADNVTIIQLGGNVRKSSGSVIGAFSEQLLEQFSCNKLFLGVDGISTDFGISTSNVAEASLNKKMIRAAEKIYILGDSSKIGKKGFGKICELNEVDLFITDREITDKQLNKLESAGVNVVVV